MILLDDIVLPDPHDVPPHVALAAYRMGRKAAVLALRHVQNLIDRIDYATGDPEFAGTKHKREALTQRLRHASTQKLFYGTRLVQLRVYRNYCAKVVRPRLLPAPGAAPRSATHG